MNIKVPLVVLESPYRDISMPLIKYIKKHRAEHGSEVVTVYTPQYIVGHWWETLLHNHKARRIRHKLMLVHGVVIALVPWLLDSSTLIYGRRSRPLPGQDRRGEPVRPVMRKPMPPAPPKKTTTRASEPARRLRRRTGRHRACGSASTRCCRTPTGEFPLSTSSSTSPARSPSGCWSRGSGRRHRSGCGSGWAPACSDLHDLLGRSWSRCCS